MSEDKQDEETSEESLCASIIINDDNIEKIKKKQKENKEKNS